MENSYLAYLHNSLGLEHVILPERSARVEFQSVGPEGITREEAEMLDKIIGALKLPANGYAVRSGTAIEDSASPLVVVFTDDSEGRGEWTVKNSGKVLKTFSLASMLRDPSLKKECWAHLQTIKDN